MFSSFTVLVVFNTSGEKGEKGCTSSTGATEVFKRTGSSQRTGMLAVNFDVLFTWIWSFNGFVVSYQRFGNAAGRVRPRLRRGAGSNTTWTKFGR